MGDADTQAQSKSSVIEGMFPSARRVDARRARCADRLPPTVTAKKTTSPATSDVPIESIARNRRSEEHTSELQSH